ncbi:unnamed protein product [Pocillopora meandrina]|uniref:Kinesin-like protein n=2 Tax=Pocilloporidae TaxID=46729 RepID=A0AAU9W9S8_9CNID|nr:unnamed protein product [Pocillopora meandrina]
MLQEGTGRVKVYARIRPTARFAQEMIELLPDGKSINIHCKKDLRRGYINNQVLDWSFNLDRVLHNASQSDVYEECAKRIVTEGLDGYNGTILAYGQTGAGKTFTMTGSTEKFQHRGVIPRAIQQVYREIRERSEHAVTVRISYLEIYNEHMFDLLSTLTGAPLLDPSQMTVTEDDDGYTRVKGLSIHQANSEEEALNLLFEGETNRIIAQHALNKRSSRSHCVFTIYIESHSRVESNTKYVTSKLNFVDLAGSERLGKTLSVGDTQVEAMYINKSLTFLEQAVIALADRRRDHVPFRQSKLTHVLKDSIGGKCNTLLIANVWGEAAHIEETLSTLRFGSRMMNVPSEPAVTEHFDMMRLCKQHEKEIRTLRQELAMHDTLTNRSQISYEPLSESQIQDVREQVKRFLAGEMNDIELVNVRQIKETFAQFRVIVNTMKADVEEKLREKYVLQERDGATSAAADKQGTVRGDNSGLVGEVDGRGFGVGVVPPGVKPNVATLVSTRKVKSRGKAKERDSAKSLAPGSGGQMEGQAGSDGQDRGQSPSAQSPTQRMATPPPKSEAFEEFKQERGSEINRILNQNKEILREKKKKAKELSSSVNSLMEEINDTKEMLETRKQNRLEQGEFRTDDGQVIIDEDEYELVCKAKDLKLRYRRDYEDLLNTKSEVTYCEKLVNQCRHRLVTEFDNWYSESFLGADDEPKGGREGQVPEDEQEKFDRLQLELLMEHPDSVPYYNAKMQTERRMHLTASGRQQKKRKPGALIATVRNKPPTTLTVT